MLKLIEWPRLEGWTVARNGTEVVVVKKYLHGVSTSESSKRQVGRSLCTQFLSAFPV